jgi:hypothetical protein
MRWHGICFYNKQNNERRKAKMKTEIAKKGLYAGAGAGLALFALIGLLPGSFIGGAVGLSVAGSMFGIPVGPQLLSRVIVGLFMVLGIMVAGVVFVVGGSLTGWSIGYLIDLIKTEKTGVADLAEHQK